jgi:hypothetical protein
MPVFNEPAASLILLHRQSSLPVSSVLILTRTQPGTFDPGMLGAVLDSEGRLVELDAAIMPFTSRSRHAAAD